jgi:phenylalanyl-tRNA synthetase beta chain
MRVPLSWLRDYVAFDLSRQALADALTMRGLEVSAIEVSGADWTDVVVGRLLSIDRHPNADKLWLTSVDVGSGEPLLIVCGADNIDVGWWPSHRAQQDPRRRVAGDALLGDRARAGR